MKKHLFAVALAAVALGGCTSTLKPAVMNAEGRIDTSEEMDPEDIQVAENFKPEWKNFVVISEYTENDLVNDFYYQTIVNSERFGTVYNKDALEQFVLAEDIDGVTDSDSLLSMRNLARDQGGFLFIRPKIEFEGGYNFSGSIEAIDAETGKTVFRADKSVFNWAGLDNVMFYPIMNTFLGWIDGEHTKNTDEITGAPVDEEEAEDTTADDS